MTLKELRDKADAVVRVVWYGIDGNSMYFNPNPDHIKHTR